MYNRDKLHRLKSALDDLLEEVGDTSLGWEAAARQGDVPPYDDKLDDVVEILDDILARLKDTSGE